MNNNNYNQVIAIIALIAISNLTLGCTASEPMDSLHDDVNRMIKLLESDDKRTFIVKYSYQAYLTRKVDADMEEIVNNWSAVIDSSTINILKLSLSSEPTKYKKGEEAEWFEYNVKLPDRIEPIVFQRPYDTNDWLFLIPDGSRN